MTFKFTDKTIKISYTTSVNTNSGARPVLICADAFKISQGRVVVRKVTMVGGQLPTGCRSNWYAKKYNAGYIAQQEIGTRRKLSVCNRINIKEPNKNFRGGSMRLTQASNKTKGKVYVARLDDGTYQIKGPKFSHRLCSAKTLFSAADYQTALTVARLWRLELTLDLLGYKQAVITNKIHKYHELGLNNIPQFTQMLRDSVQP